MQLRVLSLFPYTKYMYMHIHEKLLTVFDLALFFLTMYHTVKCTAHTVL